MVTIYNYFDVNFFRLPGTELLQKQSHLATELQFLLDFKSLHIKYHLVVFAYNTLPQPVLLNPVYRLDRWSTMRPHAPLNINLLLSSLIRSKSINWWKLNLFTQKFWQFFPLIVLFHLKIPWVKLWFVKGSVLFTDHLIIIVIT